MVKTIIFTSDSKLRLRSFESVSDAAFGIKKVFNQLHPSELGNSHAFIEVSRKEQYVVTPIPFSEPYNIEVLIENLSTLLR